MQMLPQKGLRSERQHGANVAAPPLGPSRTVSASESTCISEIRTNSDRVTLASPARSDANVVSAELPPFPGQVSSLNGKIHESRCLKSFLQLLQDLGQITQVHSLYVLEVKSGHRNPPLGTWENSQSLRSAEQPPPMEVSAGFSWLTVSTQLAFASPHVCSSAKWGSLYLTPSPGIWKLI